MPTATEVARFTEKLVRLDSGCIVWTAAKNTDGYGVFRRQSSGGERGRLVLAHRFYREEILNLPIPAKRELDHVCVVRHCVAHTEPVTHRENCQRAARRRKAS